jgi:hypothetical protein
MRRTVGAWRGWFVVAWVAGHEVLVAVEGVL